MNVGTIEYVWVCVSVSMSGCETGSVYICIDLGMWVSSLPLSLSLSLFSPSPSLPPSLIYIHCTSLGYTHTFYLMFVIC